MANKNKGTQPTTRIEREAHEARVAKRDKIILIVFAIVALVAIVGTIVGVIVANIMNEQSFTDIDFTTDVSGFLYISPQDYKSFDVEVSLDKPDELQLKNEILKALYSNRAKDPTYQYNQKNQTVKPGHDVNLYYVGYTLDGEGNKVYFDGGCNLADSAVTLGIGSGKMITGFELALLDKNSADYSAIRVRSANGGNTTISSSDIVCITYTGIFFDSTKNGKNLTAIINLNDPNVEEIWGKELIDGLARAEVGETLVIKDDDGKEKNATFYNNRTDKEGVIETDAYTDVVINKAYEVSEGEALTIDVSFPKNYSSTDLAGKAVKFDIYIMTSMVYEAPEYNEDFVTKTLGLTEDDLADYEGDTILEKYESKLMADLQATYDSQVLSLIEAKMWEHYVKVAKFKNLPEGEVLDIYNSGIYEIESYYESYGYSAYGTVDSFACTYLGLSSGSDWRAYIRQQAEYQVKQMLVFYYVTQQENFIPTEEEYKTEYEKTYNEMFDSYLASKEFKREDYDSEEKYQSALEGHKKTFAAYYGEDYFRETVYYRFGLERIKDFANIIEK